MTTLEASPQIDNAVDPMWKRSGEGSGWNEQGSHERGLTEDRDVQGGVLSGSGQGLADSLGMPSGGSPSVQGIVDQINRVFTERGYPSVSTDCDIEQAVSLMVLDAQEGWTCFADAEACRVLQQKNSLHA
jgi:hypothetical protein